MNQAKRNNTIFQFDRLNVSRESTLNGFYNLNIQKNAWYYELPVENASTWKNGKHYWLIEIQGSAIREGMQIKDQISSDNGIVNSYLHSDSLVGIYQGNLLFDQYNHIEELNQAGLVNQKDLFTSQFENNKNYKDQDCFSELILTAKQNIQLGENNNLYIVICTEPASIPSQYRAVSTYKNEVYLKDFNETTFEKQADASQELYGGGDILKELGQTFEYDGSTITNILPGADNGNTSKICKELLQSNGVFASWAFKVNYAGQMRGDYRILEDIPSGMELSYIRIKWHGGKSAQIQSKEIDGLDGWTSYTNTTTNDNRESQTTTYYVKENQALIQLGAFIDGHERDNYSVDVQVVCRVNDPDVLLGGKSKTFENKVTLQTTDGSENLVSATSNATINKNSLDKEHVTDRQKINYTITVNPLSQKLPTNIQDEKHLTIVDKIGSNLELNAEGSMAASLDDETSTSTFTPVTLTEEQKEELIDAVVNGTVKNSLSEDDFAKLEQLNTQLRELREMLDDNVSNDFIEMYDQLLKELKELLDSMDLPENIQAMYNMLLSFVTSENLGYLSTCLNYMKDSEAGFDFYAIKQAEDGSVNVSTLTTNGFGDRYNHGLRIITEVPGYLVIGTANPFFGAQVWRAKVDNASTPETTPTPEVTPSPEPTTTPEVKPEPTKTPESKPADKSTDTSDNSHIALYGVALIAAIAIGFFTFKKTKKN